MKIRIPIALSFSAGLLVCAVVLAMFDQPDREPTRPAAANLGPSAGAMPRSREHAAVLSWIFEHRPAATHLEHER